MPWTNLTARFKNSVRGSSLFKLVTVFVSGSLGQRAVATLGVATVVYGIFRSMVWVVLILAGCMLCFFSIQDYDRVKRP